MEEKPEMIEQTSIRDRISELPSHIRQKIISLLPTKQAVSTSILSTTWRYDWITLSCIDFHSQHDLTSENPSKCLQILDLLLRKLRTQNTQIRKLCINLPLMSNPSDSDMGASVIDQWLCFVGRKGLEELTIHVRCYGRVYLPNLLHGCVMVSSCTLTKLDLKGFSLDKMTQQETMALGFDLPVLEELSLMNLVIEDQLLNNLVAHCPSIVKLRIRDCCGFEFLQVLGLSSLKDVEVVKNSVLSRFKIGASSVNRLWFEGDYDLSKSLIIMSPSGTNIVDFKLSCCGIKDGLLNEVLDQLARLRRLVLEDCRMLKSIRIVSGYLVELSIVRCRKLVEVELNSPRNLSSFVYHIEKSIISLRSDAPFSPSYAEVHLPYVDIRHVECCRIEREHVLWHRKIFALLAKLSHSRHVSLLINWIGNAIVPQGVRESVFPPLQRVEHLEFSLEKLETSDDLIQCIDSLLWLSPRLKYVRISGRSQDSWNIMLELKYKEESEEEKSCSCAAKCWRHSLEDFEIREQQGYEDDGSLRRFFEDTRKGVII